MAVPAAMALPKAPTVQFDIELIRKLSQKGPRYTSYPTADRFSEASASATTCRRSPACAARGSRQSAVAVRAYPVLRHRVLLLRLQQDRHQEPRARPRPTSSYLKREIEMQGRAVRRHRTRSSNCISAAARRPILSRRADGRLMAHLRRCFALRAGRVGEYSIEVDPRTVDARARAAACARGLQPHQLRRAGFRSRSAEGGATASSREQSARWRHAGRARRRLRSINVDLIYGLPRQTREHHSRARWPR